MAGFLGVSLLCAGSPQLVAQDRSRERFAIDLGFGSVFSLPDPFEGNPCGTLVGLEGGAIAGLAISGNLAVETSAYLAGSKSETCSIDALLDPEDGFRVGRAFPDGTSREPYLRTSHHLVFDVSPDGGFGGRLFAGGGRLWTKGEWFWSVGGGVRFGPGRTWSVEVERTAFTLDFVDVTETWRDGALVDRVESATKQRPESMWVLRVRIPVFRHF
jgi:hypothetical protein